jgi:hypothetical protein
MRLRRNQAETQPAPLSAVVTVMLLEGYTGHPAEGSKDNAGALALFQGGQAGFAALWDEHREYLLREALRRNIQPRFKGAFYAERQAQRLAEGGTVGRGGFIFPLENYCDNPFIDADGDNDPAA